ncbi:hypothetical protein HaLaN_20252 [Haematococcus lacustris]|uniref:Uncharacterized protein n=1 Tax=Haematococcus lacustris TaxID=44745 RepID=A0A699ZNI3_HAELA|nr:hypothetical protein HaLaN_20252 [Haematococcus lacustris]
MAQGCLAGHLLAGEESFRLQWDPLDDRGAGCMDSVGWAGKHCQLGCRELKRGPGKGWESPSGQRAG